ncbi:MAG: FAD-dependent oxidoreductase [Clostridia bacterium]|nr:FAD-dependent oxidoreductase [Clostridia bacterium]
MPKKVVIAGAGWAGISAAIISAKKGMDVILIERTDMLLGTGLVGGIMRNNGRYTGAEEAILMGAFELFEICDNCSVHKNIDFPFHKHASIYDSVCVYKQIIRLLREYNVNILTNRRAKELEVSNRQIRCIVLDDNKKIYGDAFIDCTGSAGPPSLCRRYGNGCVMCIMRCPTFGGRISLSDTIRQETIICKNRNGSIGAMSGSCKINKATIDKAIIDKIEQKGFVIIPVDLDILPFKKTDKVCQQYTAEIYENNIIMLDAGNFIKMMKSFLPLSVLHSIEGFENARYDDPYAGSVGNSIRFTTVSPRDNYMKVLNTDNLFCAGECSGPIVGHTEAIITGALAGCNASNYIQGKQLVELSTQTACGDFINFSNKIIDRNNQVFHKVTMSGSVYFDRMKQKKLYTVQPEKIENRIKELKYKDLFIK